MVGEELLAKITAVDKLEAKYSGMKVSASSARELRQTGISEKLFTNAQVSTLDLLTGDAALIAWDGTDWSVLA